MNMSKAYKLERQKETISGIIKFLQKNNIQYSETTDFYLGKIIVIPWKDKQYIVNSSGKLNVKGKRKWYKFSKVFFNE